MASRVDPGTERPALQSLHGFPRRFGRYVLLRRVAKGGMGEVSLACSLGLEGAERPVIIKTIRAEHRTDKSFRARFLDEARVQSQLEHSGVAQIIEATTDEESGEPFVAVEYVEGKSLGDIRSRALAQGKAVGWHEAVAIIQLAAEALAHVHTRCDADGRPLGIVHRDLSPQNLMVGFGGDVKIIDFGTARGENRRCHTVAGVVYAKPGYVAPEVANGDSGDSRVDLYALGVMLWELCAGRRFLQGEASSHMAQVSKNEKNLPSLAAEGVPAAVDRVLARLTAFDRNDRFGSTREAARELAALLSSAPALGSGERGVRARVSELMSRLFPTDGAKARRDFERLVAEARKALGQQKTPTASTPAAARVLKDEADGLVPGTRYRLVRELSRSGGMRVLETVHADLGRPAIMKVAEDGASPTEQHQISREGKLLSELQVPGIANVIDAGRTLNGMPFVVLQRATGRTVRAAMEGDAPTTEEAIAIALGTLSVLAEVHRAGVVHRDVKPDNLIWSGETVTLIDFGIAKMGGAADIVEGSSAVSIWGTPEYMAPEQASRPAEVDARADIYGVGAVLYELLTGHVPFSGPSAIAILEAKSQGSPERPSEVAPQKRITRALDEVVLKALARHPSLRFDSAESFATALRRAADSPAARRSSVRALAASVSLVSVVAGLGLLGFTHRDELASLAPKVVVEAEPPVRVGTVVVESAAPSDSKERAPLVVDEPRSASPAGVAATPDEASLRRAFRPEPTLWAFGPVDPDQPSEWHAPLLADFDATSTVLDEAEPRKKAHSSRRARTTEPKKKSKKAKSKSR